MFFFVSCTLKGVYRGYIGFRDKGLGFRATPVFRKHSDVVLTLPVTLEMLARKAPRNC